MGRYRCAYNCKESSGSDVKFFKFPLNNSRKLKKWLTNMNLEDWSPSRFSVLCIHHFEEQYIDRTGKNVTLRGDAVPTIFSSSKIITQKEKVCLCFPVSMETSVRLHLSHNFLLTLIVHSLKNKQTNISYVKLSLWRIIADEGLMKIKSFPHFFHGHYCAPHMRVLAWNRHFAILAVQVQEAWQWLGLDVRGPLPQTLNGHRYILTVADYYSRWVEAVPMESCLPPDVAKNVADMITYFGYPFRILSRLPHDIVHKVNQELKDQLKISIPIVVQHQQTGSLDLVTPQLIDRMVFDLTEEHAADWNVYLPAKVFSLCFNEHPSMKNRPFSLLCCNGVEPYRSPRELDVSFEHLNIKPKPKQTA
uniref:THAP-type domain-containing protein n=1 Tax=Oryzias sinensis TaxID=183150 RepID=A0A8C7X8U3_9TELE